MHFLLNFVFYHILHTLSSGALSLGLEQFAFWNVVLNWVTLDVQKDIFVFCKSSGLGRLFYSGMLNI